MVNVTSLSGNGLRDWLIQRISAVIIAVYTIFILIYLILHPDLAYGEWQLLFSSNLVRIFSVLTLVSLLGHAWIGLWTISTDYLKASWLRLSFQLLVISTLLICVIWGIAILWGM